MEYTNTYPIFPRMQIHDQILWLRIPVSNFALIAMFVHCHLIGIERMIRTFMARLCRYCNLKKKRKKKERINCMRIYKLS